MTMADGGAQEGRLRAWVAPREGLRGPIAGIAPGREEGPYRVGWVGRPRVLGAKVTEPAAFVRWLLEQWPARGAECLSGCGGSWALWLEDRAQRRLWLATDRFASTPVYYAHQDGRLVVADDLEAILAEVPRKAHPRALIQYLVLRIISGEEQFVADIKRLLPGQCLCVDCAGDQLRLQAGIYWQSPIRKEAEIAMSSPAGVERIQAAIAEEMAAGWDFHTHWAGGGVGLLFSGGVDSAFVLSQLPVEQQRTLELATFGFQGHDSPDLASARQAVTTFRTPLRWEPIVLDSHTTAAALDRVIRATLAPVDHPNFLARELAYRHLAARGVRTVIAGEGADTLLGGAWNVSIQKMVLARRWYASVGRPGWLLSLLAGLLPRKRRDQLTLIREPNWQKVCLLAKSYVPVDWLEEVLAPWGGLSVTHFPHHVRILDQIGEANTTHAVYELALMTNMVHELLAEQKMAASAGTYQWNPYLDGRFPESISPIPARLKTPGWKSKYLLYQAARGQLPAAILNRPKSGSPAPLVTWFATEKALGGLLETVTAANSFCGHFLDAQLVRPVVERFRTHPNARDAEILWVLVNLERWAALVLHHDSASAPL
jgi:asparagine synthase (glutamine-hydrolysing)